MGSFGRNLRRERELRGITLEEIAERTKIGARMLDAIENDRFEALPGGVFNRSFVLHYARYIGLDDRQVATEYDLTFGTPETVDVKKVVAQREQHLSAAAARDAPAAAHGVWKAIVAALLLLVATGAAGFTTRQWWLPMVAQQAQAKETTPTRSVPLRLASSPQSDAPAATQDVAAIATPTNAESQQRLQLQVDTMSRSWVAAFADGRKQWEAVMNEHESRTVSGDSHIQLRVGSAGAVVLTLNGETQAPLGRKGEPKSITFTAEDLKRQ